MCEEKHEVEDEEEGCLDADEIISGQNWRTTLPRFQKLFKNFKTLSQLFGKLAINVEVLRSSAYYYLSSPLI